MVANHSQTFGVLGAIVGDVIGSRYEFNRVKHTDFDLFPDGARYTDDTVCTLGIADALMRLADDPELDAATVIATSLRNICVQHPNSGYGAMFVRWLGTPGAPPYNSFGNGSAMRVSPVAGFARAEDDVLLWAERTAAVSHNHPEGIKGAQATAWAIDQAWKGATKESIRADINTMFGYNVSSPVEEIRPRATFDETCPISVPEAIICFLDSTSYEDAVRKAVSLSADADTQAAIAGSIAEAFYGGVPRDLADAALTTLTPELRGIYDRWLEFLSNRRRTELDD